MSPKRMDGTTYDLPDYILALIWFSGTISGDAILIRKRETHTNQRRYKNGNILQRVHAAIYRRI